MMSSDRVSREGKMPKCVTEAKDAELSDEELKTAYLSINQRYSDLCNEYNDALKKANNTRRKSQFHPSPNGYHLVESRMMMMSSCVCLT